ncbi:MAG: DUF4870 domain-containing protein [Armatimonadetes bacterium]|nr:DUF4870 domain-containing protein [Armatimonadota bacterium]
MEMSQEEKTWCMLSHLSILLTFIVPGIGGIIGALVIWAIYKDKSKIVPFHAMQSLAYQVACLVILTVGGIVAFVLTFVGIGILLYPLLGLLGLAACGYGVYGGIQCNNGVDFKYYYLGDMVRQKMPA